MFSLRASLPLCTLALTACLVTPVAIAPVAEASTTTKAARAAQPRPVTLVELEKAAGHKIKTGQTVVLKTSKGTVEIVLFPKEAPKTVENFLKLTRRGFYDGTTFHRVIPGFVSQGGDPLSKTQPAGDPQIGTGGPGWNIPDEHGNGLKHLPGVVAMAHSAAPNSAGSQFYITHGPIPHLDGGYTIFGLVTKGFEHAVAFQATDQGGKPDRILKATVR
ncbi:MAG: peptidylprolyl isomerase [Candidatus Sericytochromatia bacterium]|nr:peptidylprolyl isomerase [Candidatus Sericytochromatia bacterium]